MLTISLSILAGCLAGFLAGYSAGLRRIGETRYRSFWTGFNCGRKDVKADIPAHVAMYRRMWEQVDTLK